MKKEKKYEGMPLKKSTAKKKKKTAIIASVSGLAVLAVCSVSLAIMSAMSQDKHKIMTDAAATLDQPEIKIEQVQYFIDENQYKIELDDLQKNIEDIIKDTKEITDGEWSVYISIPSTGDTLSINQKEMQAASVIKLFIMGAVYNDYDAIKNVYGEDNIESLIESMIIISDNECADELVTMLGRGDSIKGREIVTEYCNDIGLENTTMKRMILEDNIVNDNYTTTEDTAKFLEMILNGDLPHSKEMLRHLEHQERTAKIPAGIPTSVTTANKTGELDDVQNDAAIIFAKRPYVICVMSEGVLDYQTPIDAIVEMSYETYNFLVTKM